MKTKLDTNKRTRGVVTAMITPLTNKEELDEPALEKIVRGQVEAGIDYLFVHGSVGELAMIPDDMCDRICDLTNQWVGDKVPILGGAMDNSVRRVLIRIERMAKLGADAAVVTLPYYGWCGSIADGIAHFAEIAAASPIPILAYNLPKAVAYDMPMDLVKGLYDIPNVLGLKDTRGALDDMKAIASDPARPKHFTYLPGNTALAPVLFAAGADGVVSTPSNIYPDIVVDAYKCHMAGESDKVDHLTGLLKELSQILSLPTGSAGIKCALEEMGICGPTTMRSWPRAGADDREKIKAILAKVKADYEAFKAG